MQAQIFIDKDDLFGDRKLHEFVMDFLLSHKVIGATSFEGHSGFGPDHQLQRPDRLFSFDEPPMVVTFIDEDEKTKSVIRELRELFKGGLIVTSQVERW